MRRLWTCSGSRRRRRCRLGAARRTGLAGAVALAALTAAAPAAAIDRYVPMRVPPGPGPAKYDRVFVQQLGPKGADRVLVLVPGTNAGAGSITPVAREIVRRVRGMQVWIVDRRQQAVVPFLRRLAR